ncbi:hypothetical protein SUGI_0641010 [Cryptomeria japonica]|nr:hypothetical protein SUGI_0641010 [Cryptomeria japonica]
MNGFHCVPKLGLHWQEVTLCWYSTKPHQQTSCRFRAFSIRRSIFLSTVPYMTWVELLLKLFFSGLYLEEIVDLQISGSRAHWQSSQIHLRRAKGILSRNWFCIT